MPAPYAFNGRAGTRLALLRIGTGGRVASHLGTWSDRLLWAETVWKRQICVINAMSARSEAFGIAAAALCATAEAD